MKIIGLTGGIGSGKSTISHYIESKGFPVYNSDAKAKVLMNSSFELKNKIIKLIGEEAYKDGHLNTIYIAEKVFSQPRLLQQLNKIVHPIVQEDFIQWTNEHKAPFCIKETAILFESGAYKNCDKIIVVTANKEIRLQRVMQRDHSTQLEVESRMKNQWEEGEKIALADYIIYNNYTLKDVLMETDKIIAKILVI